MGGTKIWDYVPGHEFDQEVDLKDIPVWFLAATHCVPPYTPMFGWVWTQTIGYGTRYAAEKLSIPTHKGWQHRIVDGLQFSSVNLVKDKEEIKQREAKFREAMRPYIEDFDGWWRRSAEELLGHYKALRDFDVDACDNMDLMAHFEEALSRLDRMWEIHFLGMYSSGSAFMTFEGLCKDLFGMDDTSPEFHKLMAGFDNKLFQVNRRLWQFGQEAMKAGLADIFLTSEAQEVIPKLEQIQAGREWLKEFREFLWEDGWRAERMTALHAPTWVEDPSLAISKVQGFLKKGGSFDLDETRERLVKEREEATRELMQRVPEEQRDWFLALLTLAQKYQAFSEEHDYYCELYLFALIRRACLAIGRRLVQAGTIDQPDDIFHLMPDEIKRVMPCPEYHDLHHIANRRRAEWEEWQRKELPPPIITSFSSMDEAMKFLIDSGDVIALKIVVGAMPEVKPELGADLYGICGSPGVAEGQARVIFSHEQLHEVQPGEILVAPTTFATWTPIFSLINGAVIDRGGALSHGAIVGREYGIPVVINVFEGTTKIKTGQRIKVDGDRGAVYVLE